MIFWNEYKQYKIVAERLIREQHSVNDDIQIEIYRCLLKKQTKEITIENIINILSNGEHFKPLTS